MSDVEDRPEAEHTEKPSPPEQPSAPAWWTPPPPDAEEDAVAPEAPLTPAWWSAPQDDGNDPVAQDEPVARAAWTPQPRDAGDPVAPEQPPARASWGSPPSEREEDAAEEPFAPAWWSPAAPSGDEEDAAVAPEPPSAPAPAWWSPAAPSGDEEDAAVAPEPGPAPALAPAFWLPPPPTHATDSADDHGWPMPPPDRAGEPPALLAPRAPVVDTPAPEPRPHRHSRNPVDRLTRGLPNPLRVAIDWIVTIVGAVAIVLLVKAFVVNPYRIPSSSMEPTLHCARPSLACEARYSDRVLANRFLYRLRDPRRGEIIVFRTPPAARVKCGAGGTFVKRLIGLPGDTVEVRLQQGNGYVFINGKELKEPYVQKARRGISQGFGPVKVRPGNYFMMGDNRSQSCDSRMWGTVPRGNLIGKVFATYWPPNRVSLH